MPAARSRKRSPDAVKYLGFLGSGNPRRLLERAPGRIAKAIAGLSERDMALPERPGKWSIREVLAHFADGEIILGSRLRFIAAHDRPLLAGYDENLFVARLGIANTTSKKLLQAFGHGRATTIELINRLPDAAFSREGLHSERGPESVRDLIAMYAGHDRVHEAQIARIRERLGR